MLEMNARSLQQKLETERELKQRLLEEVGVRCMVNRARHTLRSEHLASGGQVQIKKLDFKVEFSRTSKVVTGYFLEGV